MSQDDVHRSTINFDARCIAWFAQDESKLDHDHRYRVHSIRPPSAFLLVGRRSRDVKKYVSTEFSYVNVLSMPSYSPQDITGKVGNPGMDVQ